MARALLRQIMAGNTDAFDDVDAEDGDGDDDDDDDGNDDRNLEEDEIFGPGVPACTNYSTRARHWSILMTFCSYASCGTLLATVSESPRRAVASARAQQSPLDAALAFAPSPSTATAGAGANPSDFTRSDIFDCSDVVPPPRRPTRVEVTHSPSIMERLARAVGGGSSSGSGSGGGSAKGSAKGSSNGAPSAAVAALCPQAVTEARQVSFNETDKADIGVHLVRPRSALPCVVVVLEE